MTPRPQRSSPTMVAIGVLVSLVALALSAKLSSLRAQEAPTASPGLPAPSPVSAPVPTAVFDGRVLRKGDRAPVDSAVILLDGGEPTAVTDAAGYFSFEPLPAGPHRVRVQGPAVEPWEVVEQLRAGTRRSSTYYVLAPRVRYQSTVKSARAARETVEHILDGEEIKKIPGTQGDAIKAVQNMPGVARAPFGIGQLVVWGSGPGDTRVYADGAPIPGIFHFGGLRSTIPTDLVQSLRFSPGGFGAEHGQGLGGVVEVETRAPRSDGYHGYVQLDTIDGSFNVEGPISKTLSFGVSARRSWIDAFLPFVTTNQFQLSPKYWDYQLRLRWTPNPRDTVDFIALGTDDILDLSTKNADPNLTAEFHTHTFSHELILRWLHRFGDGATLSLTPSLGYGVPYQIAAKVLGVDFSVDTGALSYNLRALYRKPLSKNVRLDAGVDFQGNAWSLSINAPASGTPREDSMGGRSSGTLAGAGNILINGLAPFIGLAVSDEAKRLSMNFQARLESYFIGGHYQFPALTDPAAQSGAFQNQYFRPEVRLAASYQLFRWLLVRAAAGIYHQAPDVGSLFGAFGNPNLQPESAEHYVVGAELKPTPTLTISIDGFEKTMSSLIVHGASPSDPPLTNDGIGRVWGGELLVRQELWKNFFGWISYTLSRSERQDHPGEPFRLFQFDQTHILTIVASYLFPRGYQLGARFRYVTGNPYTPFAGAYQNLNNASYVSIAGPLFSARLDAFNELDLRLDKTFTFDRWKLSLYLDIQNVYNASNPERITPNYNYTRIAPVAGIPFFPALGVRGDF